MYLRPCSCWAGVSASGPSAQVSVSGGVSQQIAVEVDASRVSAYGLSKEYIAQILMAENLLLPGGDVQNGTKTLTVSTDAKFQSVADVANMIIALPTGGTVRLNEVADVYLESVESDSVAKMDGENCVILQVSKQSGANEHAAAEAVAAQMEKLASENRNIRYGIPYLASDFINLAVDSSISNILMGVLLAGIVVFLFLRRWGATLTIAISMPRRDPTSITMPSPRDRSGIFMPPCSMLAPSSPTV
jgi:HAE1 family hydrophobic/amphiphilic exporter-1